MKCLPDHFSLEIFKIFVLCLACVGCTYTTTKMVGMNTIGLTQQAAAATYTEASCVAACGLSSTCLACDFDTIALTCWFGTTQNPPTTAYARVINTWLCAQDLRYVFRIVYVLYSSLHSLSHSHFKIWMHRTHMHETNLAYKHTNTLREFSFRHCTKPRRATCFCIVNRVIHHRSTAWNNQTLWN